MTEQNLPAINYASYKTLPINKSNNSFRSFQGIDLLLKVIEMNSLKENCSPGLNGSYNNLIPQVIIKFIILASKCGFE